MTAAERCDLCSGCRTIHQCRARSCGIEPGPKVLPPAPASRLRGRLDNTATFAAFLILFGMPVACLMFAGAL